VSTSLDKSIRIWNAWRPPSRKKTPVERILGDDDQKQNKPIVREESVVKVRATVAASRVVHPAKTVSTESTVELAEGDENAFIPSIPPVHNTLKLSEAERAMLASKVLK